MSNLKQLLEGKDIHAIATYFDQLVAEAAQSLNEGFNRHRLAKSTRVAEPLPTATRQLSSYRTRIGTMLEYGLSTEVDLILRERYGSDFGLTFAVSHEYPDFYLRDSALAKLLRIEMKAVDAGSDEQAARFAVPTIDVNINEDLLLLVAWEWSDIATDGIAVGECPQIFRTLVIAAGDVANERDKRLTLTGGEIRADGVFVPGRGGEFVVDPGNYGKLWRLIHGSRHASEELTPAMNRFMDFLREVDKRSPRSRFKV